MPSVVKPAWGFKRLFHTLQHKQRQGYHTDTEETAENAVVTQTPYSNKNWLDSGASIGARLWKQS